MDDIRSTKILILDFGSQYTYLIARRVREHCVYSEIYPCDAQPEAIKAFNPSGIILSGGPESIASGGSARAPNIIFRLGIPILGICYGMHTMVAQLGGTVARTQLREFGHARVRARGHTQLLKNIQDYTNNKGHGLLDVWMSHGDTVTQMPPGFKVMASTDNTPIAGIADEANNFYGVQFHPEVTHTKQGAKILRRFLFDIAACRCLWTTDNIATNAIATIRRKIGNEKVLLALSGGVDSSVAAVLLQKAIGKQLQCIFVDNGLLRLNEGSQIMETFAMHLKIDVLQVNAEERFLSAIKNVCDPEEKRKIIGREFIDVFEEEATKLSDIKWLAQGTIYPDIIESAGTKTGKAQLIKSHHNVGGLPKNMRLSLIEPLSNLFKDEVRQLGLQLGLAKEIIYRHPFPGPGLGVRIIGSVKKEYAELLRLADDIFMQELRQHELYDKVSQAFAVFLPIRSVSVMGDARQYGNVVALRAVETVDYMTARWAQLPPEFLDIVSHRIVNEVEGISRVVYDISGKPPATIEWE